MTTSSSCPNCGNALPPGRTEGLCPKCLLQQGFETNPPTVAPTESTDKGGSGLPSFVAPSPAELAPYFPQLEILELLGVGGMGAVYRARQASLDRVVALKILPAEVARDPAFAERFQREAKHLARLNHPHIVTVHDINRVGDMYYILMEYVDGTNLREVIRTQSLTPQQALALVPQLCDALQYAHDEGIVHRDIKPENILLDRRGRAKIADFGLAKLVGEQVRDLTLTGTQQVMGTLRYMAPEQMLGARDVDHRADIYALGVILYELLTGDLPMGRFPLPSEKVAIDARLDEVVLKALERERERRYQQAEQIKTDVEEISSTAHAAPVKKQPLQPHNSATSRSLTPEEFEQAAGDIAAPAWGLTFVSLLQLFLFAASIVLLFNIANRPDFGARQVGFGFWELLTLTIAMPTGAIVLAASVQMRRMRSYEFAMIGSVLAIIPTNPLWLLSAPLGLWSMLALLRPNVRDAFRLPIHQRPTTWQAGGDVVDLTEQDFEHAAEDVRWASCGLLTVCGLSLMTMFVLGFMELVGMREITHHFDAGAGLFMRAGYLEMVILLTLPLAFLVLPAAIMMRSLRAYEFAIIGALIASLPVGITCVLTIPFGIWALTVLLRPTVRQAFRLPKHKRPEAWRDQDADLLEHRRRDPVAFARAKERVESRLKAPAIVMLIVTLLDLATALLMPMMIVVDVERHGAHERSRAVPVLLILLLAGVPLLLAVILQFVGALQMLRAKRYGWAMTGAIVFVLPLPMLWFLRLPLGIWILVKLTRRDVRALFATNQHKDVDDDPNVPPAKAIAPRPVYQAESPPAAQDTARMDRQLLVLAAGMVLGALLIAAGVALIPLAFALANPRFGAFWGFMGASLGCVGGGIGSLVGCWNDYRQKSGRGNLLLEPGWTWFDEGLAIYASLGLIMLVASPLAYALLDSGAACYSLALLGGIVLLQGLGFAGYRALVRAQAASPDIPREQAWAHWWQGTSPFFQRWTRGLLLLTYIVAMILFLTYHSSGNVNFAQAGQIERYDASVGEPSPWLTLHVDRDGHHFRVELISWAWAIAFVGLYAATIYGYTRGWESPVSKRRASLVSGSLAGVWISLTIVAALLTLAPLGQFAGGYDTLQPRDTLAVEDNLPVEAEGDSPVDASSSAKQ